MSWTLHGTGWSLLATVGPLLIGALLLVWVMWKG